MRSTGTTRTSAHARSRIHAGNFFLPAVAQKKGGIGDGTVEPFSQRLCQVVSFKNTAAFVSHPCVSGKLQPVGAESEAADLRRVISRGLSDPATVGDLRVMICRVCGVQENGVKFHVMVGMPPLAVG